VSVRAIAAAGGVCESAAVVAGAVEDPELPGLTIADLGILRGVVVDAEGHIEVRLTPTYSGCPAVEVIEHDVRDALAANGFEDVRISRVLSPPWTTAWITSDGRRKLAAGGIAPPGPAPAATPPVTKLSGAGDPGAGNGAAGVSVRVAFVARCPHCGSRDTEVTSPFGSTPCKALHRCRSCTEPFDYFKPL
jgi:ring-1,2-phenylacetyl-CoA epoxidase subunit PaaD